jgi:hypothetical protein
MFDRSARILNAYRVNLSLSRYKQTYNLYRNIRSIYNPVKRLVEFYAGAIYPGLLSDDGDELPEGVSLAMPFSKKTPPALKDAIAQFWQWTNWQALKSVHVRYGAALGSVLIEVVDDLEACTITAAIQWPGFVSQLALDAAGNVKSYTLEYMVQDETGVYIYRKDVDAYAFRYYRDGEPWDYTGYGAVQPNPYGFVPAVWIKHTDAGSDRGSPAVAGGLSKIDELNNLASHVNDQIHKVIGAPVVFWGSGGIQNLSTIAKRGATAEFVDPAEGQESVLMLRGPADGHVDSLAGSLSISEAGAEMDRLLQEIEHDFPELGFYSKMQEMSQVTGPAASRMFGPVEGLVIEKQAAYDLGNIKLFQMAVAIGGFRANSGAWGPLTQQQQKFAPFDLNSYMDGDLDLMILPRLLLKPTKLEEAQEEQAVGLGMQAMATAGVPLEMILRKEGWSEADITLLKRIVADKQRADQQAALDMAKQQRMASQADLVPAVGQ